MVGLSILLLALPAAAQVDGVRYQEQPTVVGCAAAAAAMVASALGVATDGRELLRALPVYRDGVAIYDLEVELERRGLHVATWSSTVNELRRLLSGGLPVIVALDDGGKHVVVAVGYDQAGLALCDPGAPGRVRLSYRDLDAAWARAGHQVVLVWSDARRPPLPALGRRLVEDRRFRAAELRARARQQPDPALARRLTDEADALDRSAAR